MTVRGCFMIVGGTDRRRTTGDVLIPVSVLPCVIFAQEFDS